MDIPVVVQPNKRKWGAALAVVLPICCSATHAGFFVDTEVPTQIQLSTSTLTDIELEQQRGGFIDVDGFKVDIGLQKMVLFDGVVVAQSSLVIPPIDTAGKVQNKINSKMAVFDNKMDALDSTLSLLGDTLGNADILAGKGLTDSEQGVIASVAPAAVSAAGTAGSTGATAAPVILSKQQGDDVISQFGLVQTTGYGDAPKPSAMTAPVSKMQPAIISMSDTSMVIQNTMDNRIIQSLQVINIELSDIKRSPSAGIRSRLLPQIIQSAR